MESLGNSVHVQIADDWC